MKNLIVIPAYNEAGNIVNTIENVRKNAPDFDYIIVNDGSKDNTLEVCRENRFNYLDLPVNLGIGGAVQTGIMYGLYHGYDTVVQFDGDGQHDAKYLEDMLEEMQKSGSDMVIGSRFIEGKGFQSTKARRFGIKYFTGLIKLLTGKTITDPTSGMRLIDKKLMKVFSNYYPKDYPEPESLVLILSKGYKVSEIPVVMKAREEGKSSINIKASFYYMLKVSVAIINAKISGHRHKAE